MNKSIVSQIGLALLVVLMCYLYFKKCEDKDNSDKLYSASQDVLHQLTIKDGRHIAYISTLEATTDAAFLKLKTKDSTILRLQAIVKADKKATEVTVFSNKTIDTIKGKTIVTFIHDTIKSDTTKQWPVYSLNTKTKWYVDTVIARHDSIFNKRIDFNSFEYKQTFKSNGFFKAKTPIVMITNLNPNTITTDLRSFEVVTDSKHGKYFILGSVAGVIATALAVHYLK